MDSFFSWTHKRDKENLTSLDLTLRFAPLEGTRDKLALGKIKPQGS